MNQKKVIDVTKIEPKLKHSTIFKEFDLLKEGDALVINNDHDPKPLYYQLIAERGNNFTWEYLSKGPEIWEVSINKIVNAKRETIGDIVAKDIRKAVIFGNYGIDYCCGGKKTIEEVCIEKGIELSSINAALQQVNTQTAYMPLHQYNSWQLSFLADYIINVHHAYVKENLPIIEDLAIKVADHHGKVHVELTSIEENVSALNHELTSHLKKEEMVLFPFIKQMENNQLRGIKTTSGFGSIQSPISMMLQEHDSAGEILEEIKHLTNNYTLPEGACNSYALLYHKLQEFTNDLHLHIHLENNILFPKAIAMETSSMLSSF